MAYCNEHGFLRAKARMKHSDNGNIYVIKTIKQISEKDAKKVIEKQDLIRLQRKSRRKSDRNKNRKKD